MAHCTGDDIAAQHPELVAGVAEEELASVCEQASTVIDYYTLAPGATSDILKRASVQQAAAILQTGNLGLYGLREGTVIKIGAEQFIVAQKLCDSARWILTRAGLTKLAGE